MQAQHKISFMPGLFYNGSILREEVKGLGLVAGLDYIPGNISFFSIELRSKWGYYMFDDGTKWHQDKDGSWESPKRPGEPRLKYSLFSPQIGIVPKFYWHLDESVSFFLENELAVGLMSGKFKFNTGQKITFTEPVFSYNIGVGAECRINEWAIVMSTGISTLNFRKAIDKHKPRGYSEKIEGHGAFFYINMILKIPL